MANQQGKIYLLLKHCETASKRKRESGDEEEGSRKKPKHDDHCTKCEKAFRLHDLDTCPICKKMLCSDCFLIDDYCSTCTTSICGECKRKCTKCDDYHCTQCDRYGGLCECCIFYQTKEELLTITIL